MAVIELALPGQEATTYELIVTTGNAALTLNGVIGTQLLTPMKATSCEDDDSSCATSSDSVDVTTTETYTDSDGPYRFTCYTLVLVSISIVASFIFTRFLPASKEECQEWKEKGEALGTSRTRGRLAIFLSLIVIAVSRYPLSLCLCRRNIVMSVIVWSDGGDFASQCGHFVSARSGWQWLLREVWWLLSHVNVLPPSSPGSAEAAERIILHGVVCLFHKSSSRKSVAVVGHIVIAVALV